ncbi:MAG: hypothetical protein ACYTF7_10975 [Planctomycetota bacterium]|jgi:hypothetical protein
MLKYFRKYNTYILMVGGVLLLIVFLLPQLPQMTGAGVRNPVIARFSGGEIHLRDRQDAANELQVLSRMRFTQLGIPITSLLLRDEDLDESRASDLWMLLVAMAERDGLVGGPEDGRNLPSSIARSVADSVLDNPGMDPDFFDPESLRLGIEAELEASRTTLLNSGVSPSQLDTLFAKARGVLRMYELYESSVKLSEPEIRKFAARVLDQVGVQWVPVRSNRFFDQLRPIEREEYLDHYEQYKDVMPGEGEFGFGYKRYPGYRVEWIEIERRDISNYVEIDPLEANTFYQQNRARFTGEWADERGAVFEELTEQKVDEILAAIDREMVAILRQTQGQLERGDDGFYELPDNWELLLPSLAMIKSQLESFVLNQYGVPNLDGVPIVRLLGGWRIAEDVEFMPTAMAELRHNGQTVTGEDLIINVRDLYPESDVRSQTQILYGPARTPAGVEGSEEGNVYYFRIVETRPSGPPDTYSEVKELVENDYARYLLYYSLRQVVDNLKATYIQTGIDAYAEQLRTDPNRAVVVSREGMQPYQTVDFNTDEIREAIMAHAAQFDPTVPTSSFPIEDRLLVVEMPKALSLAVIELIDIRPLSQELYQERKLEAESLARAELLNKISERWPYTWEQLVETQGYESLDDDEDEEEEEVVEETSEEESDEG